MPWTYKLKRLFGNRYALTAVLFLAITLWGAFTALFGVLELKTACLGYAVPEPSAAPAKQDPVIPRRRAFVIHQGRLDLPAEEAVTAWSRQLSDKTAAAEAQVTKALEEDHSLIQLYGAFASFTDRTVVEDTDAQYSVIRLPNGSLTFVGDGQPDAQVQAAELGRLKTAAADRGAAFLYLQAPSKLEPGNTSLLPYGVDDPSNLCADRLLDALEAAGVDHMDLREVIRDAGGTWTDWFYQTDHHWTAEAAFLSFQSIAQRLEDYDQVLTVGSGLRRRHIRVDPRCTDPDSYTVTTLDSFFLGSQGKRVGSLYAGSDDFSLWTPNYPTLFHYAASTNDVDRYGDITDTVLFPQRVEERDYFGGNPYTYYAGGDYPCAWITNYYNPQGPRLLLIRDSYACAITPYLALCSSRLVTVDPRSYTGNLLTLIEQEQPDVVLVLYSSGMVRSEDYYRLLPQPGLPSKADALKWKDDWYAPKT